MLFIGIVHEWTLFKMTLLLLRFMFELEEPVTVMEGEQMCIANQLNIF